MVNLLGGKMKEYVVKPCDFTDNREIKITRKEINTMKRKIKSGGSNAYNLMLNLLKPRIATMRVCLVSGSELLVKFLTFCIFAVRTLIVSTIFFLLYKMWFFALGSFAIVCIVNFVIQTMINYELGARLFILDNKLDLKNDIEINNFDYYT